MGAPATRGQLRTTLEEMNISDYIPCKYLSGDVGSPGEFVELGVATGEEIPIATITTEEYRACRGGSYGLRSFRTNFRATSQNEETGSRPVLEYIELDGSSRQTTLFY